MTNEPVPNVMAARSQRLRAVFIPGAIVHAYGNLSEFPTGFMGYFFNFLSGALLYSAT